jgi:RNA polymerase sigma-70 factor (ECF subfamily)
VELLLALRRGDPTAAPALYARARPQVDKTIVHLLGAHDADHEDLVQLSMIELLRSIGRFRGECSLDTWTSRVTAHAVFKEVRRRQTQRRLVAAATEVAPESGRDLARDYAARDTLARIRAHIDALDPLKGWTVTLHDVCGYDLREIAEITEASVAAAQSRLVRGRAELHARIAADPALAEDLEREEGAS